MDSVDRRTRGAAHGSDHELMLGLWRLLVSDTSTGSGYAYLDGTGVAAARGHQPAHGARLLWAALADAGDEAVASATSPPPTSGRSTSGWRARLELHTEGYLGLRGMKPPAPYLHNGALL